jgi:polysaccharide biosynthesis/export protein
MRPLRSAPQRRLVAPRLLRRMAALSVGVLALGGLAACATPAAPPPVTQAGAPSEYVLGAGDTLTVFVYQHPDLSASELPIRPDGRLSLPLVPDIEAAGQTPSSLARAIEQRLAVYVREPNVTIMVRGFQGPPNRLIRVIGEAAQPMATPYREGMTLLDVMITARGLTRYAAGNRASIVRRTGPDGEAVSIPVRLSDLLRDGDISQDVAMRPGDTLIIPQGWF